VRNSGHDDHPVRVINRIDDAVAADSDSEVVLTDELRDSGRQRLITQAVDG
jgi:hypothetical protein